MSEPSISINGHPLTPSQAMTVRCAVESFAAFLSEFGLGDDENGNALTAAYMSRIEELRALIRSSDGGHLAC